MELSENDKVILQEIQRIVNAMMSDNITHAVICDYNKIKHQIISNSRNIFSLINILKICQDLSKQVVLEILNMIFSLISTNQTSYNLELILADLLQIKIDDLALIQTLGKSVSIISELLFISEKKFVLPINDTKNSITPLEGYVFEDFLNYFSTFCSQKSSEFKELSTIIKNNLIPVFVSFGIRLLFNQPLPAVAIIRASLFFGIDPSESKLKKMTMRGILKFFHPPQIFQCLCQISTKGPQDAALDALSIVTILARTIDNWDPSTNVITANIQQFILAVLADPNILNDQARAIEIQNLLIYVVPESATHPFDNVITFLYQFSQNVLQNNPLLLTIIYPGILSLFLAFKGNHSQPGIYAQLRERMKPGLVQYVNILLNTFEVNTQQAAESIFEINDLNQIVQSLKYLLRLSDLTTIHLFIKERTLQVINDQVTVINSYKISFILIFLNSMYAEFDLFTHQNKAILFDLLFELFPIMQVKLAQYSQLAISTNTTFYIADFFLQTISTFLRENFINVSQSKMFKQFKNYCANSKKSEILSSIFKFLLFMILNGFEPPITAIVMKDMLDSPRICQILSLKTDLPNYFLENYPNFPCKFIYYFTLIKLVYSNPQKSVNFLEDLTKHLTPLISAPADPNQPDSQAVQSDNFNRFFKIISTIFKCSLQSTEWFSFFQYIFTHFGQVIEKVSDSVYCKYVLKFITNLTQTKEGENHLPKNIRGFPTTSPFTFQIFTFFCSLLKNVLKNTNIGPIPVDESIFTSPIPTYDIYLNLIQLFNPQADDDNWTSFQKVIRAMNYFMISPFPNFAIMKYYNDTCLLEFFNFLILQAQKTSPISLLSIPEVFDPLLTFIRLFTDHYYQPILGTELFLKFIVIITKVSFLSNNLSTVENSCSILDSLCREIFISDISPLKRLFDQHYILALNLLTIPEIEAEISEEAEEKQIDDEIGSDLCPFKKKAASFMYWTICCGQEVIDGLHGQIVAGVENEEVRNAVAQALGNMIHGAAFNGNKVDKVRFDEAIKAFCTAASMYSFRLDHIPTISHFFVFK